MRLSLIISILLIYSCSNNTEVVKEFIKTDNIPVERIDGAEILQTQNGILNVKITAETIERFDNTQPQLVFSNGFEVVFYNDSGLLKSILQAKDAEIDEINNIMIASNSVVLTSSKGEKLETEELIWDEDKNKIFTDRKVVITTEKELIQGEGFQSKPDFSEYSISKIKGIFNFESTTN